MRYLLAALLLIPAAVPQSKVGPEQIRVPSVVRVAVIANGSLQFAAVEGLTIDLSVSPPVLRATSASGRARDVFTSGTLGRTVFNLSSTPQASAVVEVYVNGLLQDPADYTVVGSVVTLRFGTQIDDKVTIIR